MTLKEHEALQDQFWLMDMMCRLRIEISVSQEEFAFYIGMTQSMISRIEAGRSNPTYKTLMRIAKTFDKKIDFV